MIKTIGYSFVIPLSIAGTILIVTSMMVKMQTDFIILKVESYSLENKQGD